VLGDADHLRAIAGQAGIPDAEVTQHSGTVRFDSIGAMVSTERACVWTLGGVLSDDQFARLLEEAETELKPFLEADGRVAFDMPALILTARNGAAS
jgi:hypothetical protein